MNLYKWELINKEDHVIASGTLHARSEEGAEGRIKNEVLHKYQGWEWVKLEQLFCGCGSDNDVTDFYDQKGKYFIKCYDCRFERILKSRNWGKVKKSDIGL